MEWQMSGDPGAGIAPGTERTEERGPVPSESEEIEYDLEKEEEQDEDEEEVDEVSKTRKGDVTGAEVVAEKTGGKS